MTTRAVRLLEELRPRLRRAGLDRVEVYLKQGRSRRFELGVQGRVALSSREQGWAVRAGGPRSSFFAAGSGRLEPDIALPAADGGPLTLPAAAPVAEWREPASLEAPLIVEAEAVSLLEGIERRLASELPGARLLSAALEEGASEAQLASSEGVEGRVRSRSAILHLELRGGGDVPRSVRVSLAEREARGIAPMAVARRLVDVLAVRESGGRAAHDRGEMLLAPPVAIALVAGLLPLFVGRGASRLARAMRDRGGRVGSRHLTVIDDGRLPGGVLEAPIDGEGVETRRQLLVEEGFFRQPLLDWRQAQPGQRWSGCAARPSWRDVPRPAPTHLYIEPDPAQPVAALVGSVARGFYLLDALAPARFDFEGDRFALPVCGFALRRGQAVEPVAEGVLSGTVSGLLRGVQAVGRDLSFRPAAGLLGSPTLLVSGLELRQV